MMGIFKKSKVGAVVLSPEALLQSCPYDYVAFPLHDETRPILYSPNITGLLHVEGFKRFSDLADVLEPTDFAALETLCDAAQGKGEHLQVKVKTQHGKILHVKPRVMEDAYLVLWLSDITDQTAQSHKRIKQEADELTQVQSALNSIPRPIWLRDTEQNLVWVNSTYASYVGMDAGSVVKHQKELALKSVEYGEGEVLSPGAPLALEALGTGKPTDTHVHIVYQGKRLLMRLSEIPINPLNMTLGIAYNVTREEELQKELERYQTSNKELMGHLQSAIAIFGKDERLEFYNSSFAQLWHLEEGWLNTSPSLGMIMEKLRDTRRLPEQSDFKRYKDSWVSLFTGLIDPHEDMLFLPDGSTYRMLVMPHSSGGLMMNFEDVTDRLALESSYNTLIEVQKTTLDNLTEAVAVYGGDGILKLSNPAFATMWDMNPEDLEGGPHITKLVEKMKSFFPPKKWEKKKEQLINLALDHSKNKGQLERSNDTLIEYVTVPLPDGGVLITLDDVTATMRIENALREKNKALEDAEQLKMDFLANVSYQLRTPLNAIVGFNDILDKEYFGKLNKRQKTYTADIADASQHLVNLINDILDLSTLEAGYMSLDRAEVQVCAFLAEIMDLMTDWAGKEDIKMSLVCPDDMGAIMVDASRLKQAVVNVLRNSITFTPAGGAIKIAASKSTTGVTLSVSDTGVGITEEDRIRIFEPFERAQAGSLNARLSRGGAGLGLSLVKNIVALHGGTVDITSKPGEGTTVSLFLPYLSTKTNLKLGIKS